MERMERMDGHGGETFVESALLDSTGQDCPDLHPSPSAGISEGPWLDPVGIRPPRRVGDKTLGPRWSRLSSSSPPTQTRMWTLQSVNCSRASG